MKRVLLRARNFWHLCGSAGALRGPARSILRYHQESGLPAHLPVQPFAYLPTSHSVPSRMLIVLSSFFSDTNFFRSVYTLVHQLPWVRVILRRPVCVIKRNGVLDIVTKYRHTCNTVINSNSSSHQENVRLLILFLFILLLSIYING
jgi:hypothetical protein